jgi:hypothetical protein
MMSDYAEYQIQFRGEYWDGSDFVPEQKKAKVYGDYTSIVGDIMKIIVPKLFKIVAIFQSECPGIVEIDNCDLRDEDEQNENHRNHFPTTPDS